MQHALWQAIFLDRDGTLNVERPDYVKSWPEFLWLPGAQAALATLARLDVPIMVVTNQSAIDRGILNHGMLDAIHARMQAEVASAGGRIDSFWVCPHVPDARCTCRKPQPGLLRQAAAARGVMLSRSVFVGDSLTDYQAAQAAGCHCVLVRTGRQGAQLDEMVGDAADVRIVDDLPAVALLLAGVSTGYETDQA